MTTIKENTRSIAKELNITGPFNTQFLAKDDWVGVIETNLRASRSVHFVSKTYNVDFIRNATKAIMGKEVSFDPRCDQDPGHIGVKSPQFSFHRLLGADPVLGVEMSSTGEVACFGETVSEAFLKSLKASNVPIPSKNSTVCICANEDTDTSIVKRIQGLDYNIVTSNQQSSKILSQANIEHQLIDVDDLKKRKVDLVLDMSQNASDYYDTRRTAIDYNVSLITNDEQIKLLATALEENPTLVPKTHQEYFGDKY